MTMTEEQLYKWGTKRIAFNNGKYIYYVAIVHNVTLGNFKTRKKAHERAIQYAKENGITPYTRKQTIPHLCGAARNNPELRDELIKKIQG